MWYSANNDLFFGENIIFQEQKLNVTFINLTQWKSCGVTVITTFTDY